jgi:MSHA biogenesis protein MshJ
VTRKPSPIQRIWRRQAERIDALSLRERAIMFVSLAAALVALADFSVLSPALGAGKRLAAEVDKRNRDLATLRERVAAAEGTADTPVRRLQSAIEAARAESRALDAEIDKLGARSAEAPRVADLLERVLRRHERLALVRLDTSAPPAVASAASGAAEGTLPLHTVHLSLAGAYHDIAGYLAEIERTLPGLRWAELKLARDGDGALLTLRVQLLGDLEARS